MDPKEIENALSRFADINGISTHYYEAGTGEPLILIHGGGAGADAYGNWRGCLQGFAKHEYSEDLNC